MNPLFGNAGMYVKPPNNFLIKPKYVPNLNILHRNWRKCVRQHWLTQQPKRISQQHLISMKWTWDFYCGALTWQVNNKSLWAWGVDVAIKSCNSRREWTHRTHVHVFSETRTHSTRRAGTVTDRDVYNIERVQIIEREFNRTLGYPHSHESEAIKGVVTQRSSCHLSNLKWVYLLLKRSGVDGRKLAIAKCWLTGLKTLVNQCIYVYEPDLQMLRAKRVISRNFIIIHFYTI